MRAIVPASCQAMKDMALEADDGTPVRQKAAACGLHVKNSPYAWRRHMKSSCCGIQRCRIEGQCLSDEVHFYLTRNWVHRETGVWWKST